MEEAKKTTKKKAPIETTEIRANSSLTINLGNYNSAKIEFGVTKTINRPDLVNIQEEIDKLWDEVNTEVDKQIADLKAAFK